MTIDEQYGLPPLAEAFRVPTRAFPKAVQEKLVNALLKLPQLWRGLAFDAFRRGGAMYLRVALDSCLADMHYVEKRCAGR